MLHSHCAGTDFCIYYAPRVWELVECFPMHITQAIPFTFWMLGCIARRIAARSGMTNLDFGMLSVDGQLGDDAEATIR